MRLCSGFEDTDGMYGGLVVRVADDPLATYYDYDLAEHLMIIWHWYNLPTANIIQTNFNIGGVVDAYALTVNGLAAREEFVQGGTVYMTPRAEFTVTKVNQLIFADKKCSVSKNKKLNA